MKTEAYKLYSVVFWIFLPKVIIIDSIITVSKLGHFWDTVYFIVEAPISRSRKLASYQCTLGHLSSV